MKNFVVILFYSFRPVADPESTARIHREKCTELDLKGRVIIAPEGINATLEGTRDNIDTYKMFVQNDVLFKGILIKESKGTGHAFPKLSIKVRDEIVTLGAGRFDIQKETAKELQSDDLQKWYQNNEDFVVLDLRNDYEIASGKFEKTIDPGLKNFRDLPGEISKLSNLKNKKVVTVCTGGIRCEKATCLLKKEGFTDIYQLKDGIHTYMEKYPGEYFKGTLFVFDNRMTTDVVPIKEKIMIGRCTFCDVKTENYYCDDSVRPSRKIICCESCATTRTSYLRESVQEKTSRM